MSFAIRGESPDMQRFRTKFDQPIYNEMFEKTFDVGELNETVLEIMEEVAARAEISKKRFSYVWCAIPWLCILSVFWFCCMWKCCNHVDSDFLELV